MPPEDTSTTRLGAPLFKQGTSNLVKRNVPKAIVQNVDSLPSDVSILVDNMTPALLTKPLTGVLKNNQMHEFFINDNKYTRYINDNKYIRYINDNKYTRYSLR